MTVAFDLDFYKIERCYTHFCIVYLFEFLELYLLTTEHRALSSRWERDKANEMPPRASTFFIGFLYKNSTCISLIHST